MSAQDSVSTVYKCMLRGAADYLVKPIRRNELRNLWQHVWRKQSVSNFVFNFFSLLVLKVISCCSQSSSVPIDLSVKCWHK
jgi:DNA-binding response OmpR family regulator